MFLANCNFLLKGKKNAEIAVKGKNLAQVQTPCVYHHMTKKLMHKRQDSQNTHSICSIARMHSTNFRYTEDRRHALAWHVLPIFVHSRKGNSILPIAHIPPWRVLIDIIYIKEAVPCQTLIKKIPSRIFL